MLFCNYIRLLQLLETQIACQFRFGRFFKSLCKKNNRMIFFMTLLQVSCIKTEWEFYIFSNFFS